MEEEAMTDNKARPLRAPARPCMEEQTNSVGSTAQPPSNNGAASHPGGRRRLQLDECKHALTEDTSTPEMPIPKLRRGLCRLHTQNAKLEAVSSQEYPLEFCEPHRIVHQPQIVKFSSSDTELP